VVHNKETKDQKEKIKMSDKTTRIPKEDILELLNELENEEKNNEPILHEKEKTPSKAANNTLSVIKEPATPKIPNSKNTHQ